MEDNRERLRGKPVHWISRVKEDVFPDKKGFKHITAQKVRDKYGNLKKAWKNAKKLQEHLREEDCETSVNGIVSPLAVATPRT